MTDLVRTPYCHKIRYGITGAPTIDESEMDGSHAPGIGLRPSLIELVYSAARDGKPASVAASVTGEWTRFGEPVGGQVTAHFAGNLDGWPGWLAAEARLHDPAASAAVVPAADRAAVLREVADRLVEEIQRGSRFSHPDARHAGLCESVELLRRWASEAAAVPAVGVAADTTPAETEAHPPTETWKVESPRRDQWASWGATYDDRDWAQERYESATANAPARAFRLVRATTTYTVEAEHRPVVPAQPGNDTKTRCTCADAGDCFAPSGHYADCPRSQRPKG